MQLQTESHFVRHEPCPICFSKNNLGVYSDGHKWCFGCGYFESARLSVEQVKENLQAFQTQKKNKNSNVPSIALPADFTHVIPSTPLTWLRSYDIEDRLILEKRIGWSEESQELIFPVYDAYQNLLMWQGRGFGDAPNDGHKTTRKYNTKGLPEDIDCVHTGPYLLNPNTVCVVEDFVSHLKVGEYVCPTLCLFGSSVSFKRLARLARRYKHLLIWLDYDKRRHATLAKLKANPYFHRVQVIVTEKDPKEYSVPELRGRTAYLVP